MSSLKNKLTTKELLSGGLTVVLLITVLITLGLMKNQLPSENNSASLASTLCQQSASISIKTDKTDKIYNTGEVLNGDIVFNNAASSEGEVTFSGKMYKGTNQFILESQTITAVMKPGQNKYRISDLFGNIVIPTGYNGPFKVTIKATTFGCTWEAEDRFSVKDETTCQSKASISVKTDEETYKTGETVDGKITFTNKSGSELNVTFIGKTYAPFGGAPSVNSETITVLMKTGKTEAKISDLFGNLVFDLDHNEAYTIKITASDSGCIWDASTNFQFIKAEPKKCEITANANVHQDTYTFGETITGDISIDNQGPQVQADLSLKLYKDGILFWSRGANLPIQSGETKFDLNTAFGFVPTIPSDPNLVGDWKLEFTLKSDVCDVKVSDGFGVEKKSDVNITVNTNSNAGKITKNGVWLNTWTNSKIKEKYVLERSPKSSFYRVLEGFAFMYESQDILNMVEEEIKICAKNNISIIYNIWQIPNKELSSCKVKCDEKDPELGTRWQLYPPSDYTKWEQAVYDLMKYYSVDKKYDNIYYSIWNEPELNYLYGTKEDYYNIYKYSVNAARRIKKDFGVDIKIGGPEAWLFSDINWWMSADKNGDIIKEPININFLEDFIKFCADNKLPLNFLTWHLYGNDPNDYPDISRVRNLLNSKGFTNTLIIQSEWAMAHRGMVLNGEGFNNHDLDALESEIHASYIASYFTSIVNAGIDATTYFWINDPRISFSGGDSGLFSSEGIIMPTYNAFRLIDKLGNEKIKSRIDNSTYVNVLATKSNNKIAVLLNNFENYKYAIGMANQKLDSSGYQYGSDILMIFFTKVKLMLEKREKAWSDGMMVGFLDATVYLAKIKDENGELKYKVEDIIGFLPSFIESMQKDVDSIPIEYREDLKQAISIYNKTLNNQQKLNAFSVAQTVFDDNKIQPQIVKLKIDNMNFTGGEALNYKRYLIDAHTSNSKSIDEKVKMALQNGVGAEIINEWPEVKLTIVEEKIIDSKSNYTEVIKLDPYATVLIIFGDEQS